MAAKKFVSTFAAGTLGLALIAGAAEAEKQEKGDAQPATTQASTQPSEKTHVVKKGTLNLEVSSDVVLQAVEQHEVKIKPKVYAGSWTVAKVAAPGASVKKGDVLVEFEQHQIKWNLESAENELAAARASYKKAQADQDLGAKADALALRISEDAVKNAEANVRWWESVDGPQMLLSADLSVKSAKDNVGDQEDELSELKKMYQTEDLTSATKDIVIKRAVRQLERARIFQNMAEQRTQKTKENDYSISRQRVLDAAEQARQALASLKVAQELSAVTRKNSLASARIAMEQAELKFKDIKADSELFTVKAPMDGIVAYGNLTEGSWQGGDPKNLKVGEKINAGSTIMRVYQPGKLMAEVSLNESQAFWVEEGMKARVTPTAFPYMAYETTVTAPVAAPKGNPPTFGFESSVTISNADPRLAPGMKANVKIEGGKVEDVITVPVKAVSGGHVTVKTKDGKTEKKDVTVGKSDGKNLEIKSGLSVGDEVVLEK